MAKFWRGPWTGASNVGRYEKIAIFGQYLVSSQKRCSVIPVERQYEFVCDLSNRNDFVWPNSDFKGMLLFGVEYLGNGTRQKHSYNGILIETYTRPTQRCNFEWPRVTVSTGFEIWAAKIWRNGWLRNNQRVNVMYRTTSHIDQSKNFNDTERRATSLRQLVFMYCQIIIHRVVEFEFKLQIDVVCRKKQCQVQR